MVDARDREHRQEEIIADARDPHSKTTSEDAEMFMVEQTRAVGGAAYQFNPSASPEDKAAQVKADPGAAQYDLPTVNKDTALALSPNRNPRAAASSGISAAGHADDPKWARDRTGWEPRFGNGDPLDDAGPTLLDRETWLESQVEDKWFGEWYYNAGIIIFACLSSYLVTILGGGLAWVFIVMSICSTYYNTSIRRTRRNFRDDIRRQMSKAQLETDTESLEWINSFLVKFWPIFAPVLSDTIIAAVDQVLSTSAPPFVDSLRLRTFILGTKPPRLEHVKTYPKTEEDTVLMDWKFSFNPNDTADFTARQLKNKINPKVVLEIRIGKGMISKALDVIVEDFAFSGLMRVKVKLQIPFPHVEKAEISFLGRPTIDYVCKPLGGETFGFDINFIPGLESFIQEQIHANLAPMLYDPNCFPIEIAKILAGSPVDQAVGVVQITVHGAQGLKNPDKFPGIPDGYVSISLNERQVLGQTKTIKQNANPRWNETFNIIVTSLKDNLTLQVYDWNEYRKDRDLGTATFNLEHFEKEVVAENQQMEVMSNGRARGLIQADLRYFAVLGGTKLPDGTITTVPETNTGIVKFTVEQAKELDGSKSLVGQLSPYAVLLLNGKELQVSQKLKRTNNPIWPNAIKEMLITDRKTAKLGLVIKDDRDMAADPIIGTYQIKLNDMLELGSKGQEWFHLAGAKTGRVKMFVQWKPIALKSGAVGAGGYVTPIGVMRLHFHNARELRNLETVGKSDPYARVLLSGIEQARTVTFKNNLNPDFDEVIYIPVHSKHEKVTLDVMDQESLGRDRLLGSTHFSASEFVRELDTGEYVEHNEKKRRSDALGMGGKGAPKGTLTYTCSFFPTYNVADADEEELSSGTRPVRAASVMTNGSAQPVLSAQLPVGAQAGGSSVSSITPSAAAVEMAESLAEGENQQEETRDMQTGNLPKIKVGPEDLARYESGLVIFKLLSADMAHSDCHVEVIMDDHLYPSFTSSRAHEKHTSFNETGDAMIREIDVSRMTMRIRRKADKSHDEDNEDSIHAKLTGNTLELLKKHLNQNKVVTLKGEDGRESRITIHLKYLPIKMQLDPSESINNMGQLRVEVLDAADLPAADRNGLSDPYCKFLLNGKNVFKTQVQKKTLHPAWNEFFEVPISSRTAANFKVECWDWDLGDRDDFLGAADINLNVLKVFSSEEVALGLDGVSGTVRLKMLFKPAYVVRCGQGSSTFSGTFAAPGKVIGAPVKGIGKGAVVVGGTVVRAGTFFGRAGRALGRNKSSLSPNELVDNETLQPVPSRTTGAERVEPRPFSAVSTQSSIPPLPGSPTQFSSESTTPQKPTQGLLQERSFGGNASVGSAGGSPSVRPEFGTATIGFISASGFEGANVRAHIRQATSRGWKDVHKTKTVKSTGGEAKWDDHETFKIDCAIDAQFQLQVKDSHTFGSDRALGEGLLVITDTASSLGGMAGNGAVRTVQCGTGKVTVRYSFVLHGQHASLGSPTNSGGVGGGTLRKSIMGGRSSKERV